MAKYETKLTCNYNELVNSINSGILNGSVSASCEATSEFNNNGVRCTILVFERYSFTGSNRLSLNVTVFGCDGDISLCAVASGGSQAAFFKINTFGEEAFLEKLTEIVGRFK